MQSGRGQDYQTRTSGHWPGAGRAIAVAVLASCGSACLGDPTALDPGRNDSALLAWLSGYQGLLLTLPACGYMTPGLRVANQSDVQMFYNLGHSRNNLTHNHTLVSLTGCTPASVANSVAATTFNLTYYPNRVIRTREEVGNGKVMEATLNAEGYITRLRTECTVSGAIDRFLSFDYFNRVLRNATVDDAACSWTADQSTSEYAGFSRFPARGSYTDSGGLFDDSALSYTYQDGRIVELSSSCLGGSSCVASKYQYTYDSSGRLIQEDRILPSALSTVYTYDAAGRIVSIADTSATVAFTYNAVGQMIGAVESAPAPALTLTMTY